MFYIVDDESLPSNELVCDLIIGRSLLASSAYHHMDLRNGQLYSDNNDRIQCEKVELTSLNNSNKKVLVPVKSSLLPVLSSSFSPDVIPAIIDNIRNNTVKFGLTKLQLQQLKQKERYDKICKHLSTSSALDNKTMKILKKYMLTNIHRYMLPDEVEDVIQPAADDTDIDDVSRLSHYIHELEHTKPGSEDEEKVLKHIFSIHLPGSFIKQHGIDEKVSVEHEDLPDPVVDEIDNIEYPISAPTESIDTPEYRAEKKQKLRELISSYTHLTKSQKETFIKMLQDNMDPISISGENMRQTSATVHEIDTGDTLPFREKLRNYSPPIQEIINKEIDKMIAARVLIPSNSPYATNVLLVRKPDASESSGMKNRLCAAFGN